MSALAPAPHSPTCACASCRRDLTTCSLATLATTVHAVAAQLGAHARFGARKVFIWPLYFALVTAGHRVGTLAAFGARLVLAARNEHLELARADLVAAMRPELVAFSQIDADDQQFHFVIDASAPKAWESAS